MPSKSTKSTKKSTTKNSKKTSTSKSYTSPFSSSFNSAINRGTPFNVAVTNISKRNNKSFTFVCESLFKAGLCFRQKFNGQWVYWPTNGKKTTATNWKNCQTNMWQWFVDWSICNGYCTPEQMKKNCGSQKDFQNWCKKFWGKQFSSSTSSSSKSTPKSKSKSSSPKSKKSSSTTKSYKFPTSRRTRKAA